MKCSIEWSASVSRIHPPGLRNIKIKNRMSCQDNGTLMSRVDATPLKLKKFNHLPMKGHRGEG
jgi:hypothetical protein